MPTDPEAPVHLSPLEFWYMYKTKIVRYAVLILAILIFIGAYRLNAHFRKTGSETLFEKATTVENFQEVMKKYPGTVAAGNAALRLADLLRGEKKYDEAATVLRAFVEKYPGHPLVAGGFTSLASTYEMQGKLNDALEANATAISKYPDEYTTPIAKVAQARIYKAQGKVDEARRLLEDVTVRYAQTIFGREARSELQFMNKQ